MNDSLSFFGFSDEPFKLTPDADYFYPSSSHEEALGLLSFFLKDGDGFAVLIGSPGTGKTTLIRRLLKSMPNNYTFAFIVTPMLSPAQLLKAILEDIGLKAADEFTENINMLQDYLLNLAKEKKKLLLIIDEAQSLPLESLEQIRLLSNIETNDFKPLQILLSGQPELEKIIKNKLSQLNQRITIRCYLKPLSKEETEEYIQYRFAKAGGSIPLDKKAKTLVFKISKGIPRLINSIMKRALLMAYAENRKSITKKDVVSAAESLELFSSKREMFYILAGIFFAIVLIAFVLFYFWRG
ncbi:ExeA family protein [Hippea alviniae]|uniref:ExeA family protein n=1 Tax=Hippea alviniae TaxID=1279027 RepID=UPI0003B57919|nr:AAA family ATPase [Hippea alviniae]